MKSKLITLLLSLFTAGYALSQGVMVSGEVLYGENAQPASFYPLTIQWGNPANTGVMEVYTDMSGHYTAVVPVDPAGATISVIIFDFCTGLSTAVFLPDSSGLYVADFYICTDINPPPPPDSCAAFFYYEQTDVAPPTVAFYDLSSVFDSTGTLAWQWSFGDGGVSTAPNPVHVYDAPGVYIVTLTITTADCSSTFTTIVEVLDDIGCVCPPVYDPVCVATPDGSFIEFPNLCEAVCAGYDSTQVVPCNNQPFCWANIYYYSGGDDPAGGGNGLHFSFFDGSIAFSPITAWHWDFGDGNTSNDTNPEHIYAEAGFYQVTLTITTEDGCTSVTSLWILAGEACPCPAVYDPVCVILPDGTNYTFGNACEAQCYGYEDDELVVCDSIWCICPEYYSPVCVYVVDSINGIEYYQQFDNPCFAECEGFGPEDFVPCDSTVIDSCNCFLIYDPVCVVTPDGLELHFTNACFAACAGFSPDDYVTCDPGFDDCFADFYIDLNPANPLNVNFYDQSFSATGSAILGWSWDFGDGAISNEQHPSHTFAQAGIYPVTLHIVTADSCESTVTQHICIGDGGYYEGPSCQAIFYFLPDSSSSALTYAFQDISYGNITSWQWNFGDGTGSDEQNPVHTYAQPGVYVVTLTVSGNDCSSTMSMLVVVGEDILYNTECNALFVPFLEPDSLGAFFLNLSSADAVSYLWDFGDGQTSTDFFAWHQYAQPGVYQVSLTITTANGCVNTYSATLDFGANRFMGIPSYSLANSTGEAPIDAGSLQLFPNPVSDAVTVSFVTASSEMYNISVLTLDGRLVSKLSAGGQTGHQQHQIDMSRLPAGMYLVRLQTAQQVLVQRVVKE